jgi:hypothetical protein
MKVGKLFSAVSRTSQNMVQAMPEFFPDESNEGAWEYLSMKYSY